MRTELVVVGMVVLCLSPAQAQELSRPEIQGPESAGVVSGKFALSSDGLLAAVLESGGTLRIWDPNSRKTFAVVDTGLGNANALAFSANGKWIAAAGRNRVTVHDAMTGFRIASVQIAFEPGTVGFTPDDSKVVITGGAHVAVMELDRLYPSPQQTDASGQTAVMFPVDERHRLEIEGAKRSPDGLHLGR